MTSLERAQGVLGFPLGRSLSPLTFNTVGGCGPLLLLGAEDFRIRTGRGIPAEKGRAVMEPALTNAGR